MTSEREMATYPEAMLLEAAKLTSRKEDLFTITLAAALSESPRLGRGFVEILFGRKRVRGKNLRSAELRFDTQVSIPAKACRLDMLIYMDDAPLIALEHKLWSSEGKSQLEKYLCLPKRVTPLVGYISANYTLRLSGVDRLGERYHRHPSGRLHFVWADFYELIAGVGRWKRDAETGLQAGLRTSFDKYLFQPSHWSVAGLNDGDEAKRSAADARVFKMLLPTMRALKHSSRGYDVGSSWTSDSEFYAVNETAPHLPEVRVDPRHTPGALKVVLKCRNDSDASRAEERARKALPSAAARATVFRRKHLGYSGRGNPHAVEVLTPWRTLFGRFRYRKDARLMPPVFKRHIITLVDAAR